MNNVNGKALLESVKRGDLVTVRHLDGSTFKGRASGPAQERVTVENNQPERLMVCAVIVAPGRFHFATEANIIGVESC